MRKLNRQIDPTTFPVQFTGVNRRNWELELLKEARRVRRKEIKKIDFRGKSNRWKNAKDNLLSESLNKCAYCECYFRTVAYGDVEHYRPKSKYWWLAYSYYNYSASCQLCNQKYKKAKFPNTSASYSGPVIRRNSSDEYLLRTAGKLSVDPLDNSGITITEFKRIHKKERPLSIDPYIDNPSKYFGYKHDDRTREVLIKEKSSSKKEIAESAIDLFGLNRKELRDLRYRGLLTYRFIRDASENSIDQNRKEGAKLILETEYYSDEAEFSGMYNYFKNRKLIPFT